MKSDTLFRYSLQNLLTQGGLLILALWGLPVLANGLGEADFGALSILWAFVGYFSLLDMGTSRAATKLVSAGLGRGDRGGVQEIVVAGLIFGALVGCLSAILLVAASSALSGFLVGVDGTEAPRIRTAFILTAIGIPFMLIYGTANGVLAAFRLFPQLNLLRATLGILQWGGAAFLIYNGYGILEIIGLTVGVRIVLTFVSMIMLRKCIPGLYKGWRLWNPRRFKELISFGGWLTISQVISPVFFYADRFIISSLLSVSAVAFYTLPQEALSRLSIIPSSLTMTLFPALSHEQTSGSSRAPGLYARANLVLFHVLLPVIFVLIVFASEILDAWVGARYRDGSAIVFQVIAAGFLCNAMAQIPMVGLLAGGRPDIPAKVHLVELPVAVILSFLAIQMFGIVGAAIVWTARVLVDALLLDLAMKKTQGVAGLPPGLMWQAILAIAAAYGVIALPSFELRLTIVAVLLVFYVSATWKFSLGSDDKQMLRQMLSRPE